MELFLEHIRCFDRKYINPIKPITFLIGENSTGKSTFLAALAAVCDYGFPLRPRFNEPPYNLGNFETIATYKGGRYGRAEAFSLGYHDDINKNRASQVIATYRGRQGAVEIQSLVGKSSDIEATFQFNTKNSKRSISITVIKNGNVSNHEFEIGEESNTLSLNTLDDVLFFSIMRGKGRQLRDNERLLFELSRMFDSFGRIRAISIAPIRTKPRRTYDQVTEEFTPEGEHVPFVLSRVLNDSKTRTILERFGQDSRLFSQIGVKKLGNKISDPIQVLITNTSRPANLLDVGYGVSQALPVVVESMLVAPERLLLLQQPEVHLHPRAQAALGSLFVDLHRENNKQFVVETHSDYIIDRVRQEVARGRIEADEVEILYFEKDGAETIVYPISLDRQGNLVDAPPSYRDFFFQEEMALLSR